MKNLLLPLLALALGANPAEARPPANNAAAAKTISGASLLEHIATLASDRFEGRSPGSHGEDVTINYVQGEFVKLGLAPGNPDGSYLQNVPLVSVLSKPALSYSSGARSTALSFPDDYVAWSTRTEAQVALPAAELVFVGYGVNAPEYGWDDYKGVDVRGKILLMLINDPAIPDPKNPARLDPAMFGGDAMTYYGRWTYKFDIAARLGAAGALIVHETKAASYPYEVVRNTWGRENFSIKGEAGDAAMPALTGWLQLERAKDLLRSVGHDFEALKKAALSRDFKPVALGVTVSATVANRWNEVASHNVVAKIEGSDPLLKDEYVVYTAHWDHFGIDASLPGSRTQQIFHGAKDNASGVAALLEIAKAYKALPVAPKRSVLFVLTTGEERGLLGAQYYARHPLYPLAKTLIDINIDGVNLWGRTRDIEVAGFGKSTTDEIVTAVAKRQKRVVKPDAHADFGTFYRADQFEFAKVGVPVVYLRGGMDFIGKPAGYAQEKVARYVAHDYHKVSDVVQPDWDLRGAVEDSALLFGVGYEVAQGKAYPQWKAGAEFKAARDAMRAEESRQ
ncbi:Zn-dependent M28 family amino/carboxypeptidase [Oxalobacteraceae bacterium GrIS 1.11]